MHTYIGMSEVHPGIGVYLGVSGNISSDGTIAQWQRASSSSMHEVPGSTPSTVSKINIKSRYQMHINFLGPLVFTHQ